MLPVSGKARPSPVRLRPNLIGHIGTDRADRAARGVVPVHPETRLYRDPGTKILKTARPDILLLLPMEGAVEFWGTGRSHRTAPVGLPVLAPSHFRSDRAGVADGPWLHTYRAIPSARLGSKPHGLPAVVVVAILRKIQVACAYHLHT